jgi:lysophospholipase L1-like esterase
MLNPNKTKPNLVVAACSGATTEQVLGPDLKNNQPPQISVLQSAADRNSLITVTIGGNDANVLTEFLACLDGDCSGEGLRLKAFIDTDVYPRLVNTFTELRAAAPDAVILAVGYPHLVAPEDSAACDATELGKQTPLVQRSQEQREGRAVFSRLRDAREDGVEDGAEIAHHVDESSHVAVGRGNVQHEAAIACRAT